MVKLAKYKHNSEDANLQIRAQSAEKAEKIVKVLVSNRDEWSLESVQNDDGVLVEFQRGMQSFAREMKRK